MRWMFAGYFAVVYLAIVLAVMMVALAKGDLSASVAFCGAVVPPLLFAFLAESYTAVSSTTRDRIARGLRERTMSRTCVFAVGAGAGIVGVLSAMPVAVVVHQFSAPVWITFVGVPVLVGMMPTRWNLVAGEIRAMKIRGTCSIARTQIRSRHVIGTKPVSPQMARMGADFGVSIG